MQTNIAKKYLINKLANRMKLNRSGKNKTIIMNSLLENRED